jgi:hypothetical protein
MPYIATIALDFSGSNQNAYAKLVTALLKAGWEYSETSSVYIEADDLDAIRVGLAVLAHGIDTPGVNTLSNLSVTVQFLGPPAEPAYTHNHPQALAQILGEQLPL